MIPHVNTCSICETPLPACDGGYTACLRCGTLQLCPLPDAESNAAFTGEAAAIHMAEADDARTVYLLRRLNLIQRPALDAAEPRMLDVGCSSGKLLSHASEKGWSVTGIEMSPDLADVARQQIPHAEILTGDILELDISELRPFDAIVALDVIEHVLRPREFVRRLNELLVPGGQLLLQTPNARSLRARIHGPRWNMRIPAYHFHLFTPGSLRGLLESEGFRVSKLTTASGSGTEKGASAVMALGKEKLLAALNLGNALVALASKR